MQVLSPSEASNTSNQINEESPGIKEDTFEKVGSGACTYISEDTSGVLTISRGGTRKD